MLRDPQAAFQRLWNCRLVMLESPPLKCSFPWQPCVCPLMQALALLSPSVNLFSSALFNSTLSYQEVLQMEAGFGVKGAEGVNSNCRMFIFWWRRAEAGKIQPAPLACQWWGTTVSEGQKDLLSFSCRTFLITVGPTTNMVFIAAFADGSLYLAGLTWLLPQTYRPNLLRS